MFRAGFLEHHKYQPEGILVSWPAMESSIKWPNQNDLKRSVCKQFYLKVFRLQILFACWLGRNIVPWAPDRKLDMNSL